MNDDDRSLRNAEVAAHVQDLLLAVLDADEDAARDFGEGDASLLVSRAGVTLTGFESRPDGFVAAPVNEGGASDVYLRDVLHRFELFFRQVLAGERSRSQWLDGEVYLRVGPEGFTVHTDENHEQR